MYQGSATGVATVPFGISQHGRDADAALVCIHFLGSEVAVETFLTVVALTAHIRTVVAGKDDDRILCNARVIQGFEQPGDALVHNFDHRIELAYGRGVLAQGGVFFHVLFRYLQRKVRSVVGQVQEKGLVGMLVDIINGEIGE